MDKLNKQNQEFFSNSLVRDAIHSQYTALCKPDLVKAKLLEMQTEIERLKYYLQAIEHKSCYSIGNYEGLQDVMRKIQLLAIEGLGVTPK